MTQKMFTKFVKLCHTDSGKKWDLTHFICLVWSDSYFYTVEFYKYRYIYVDIFKCANIDIFKLISVCEERIYIILST